LIARLGDAAAVEHPPLQHDMHASVGQLGSALTRAAGSCASCSRPGWPWT